MTEQLVQLLTLKTSEQGADVKGCEVGKVLACIFPWLLSTWMGKSRGVRSVRWCSSEAQRMLLCYIM